MSRRYLIVGITALAALWMYIDRVCFSTLADPIQTDLGLTDHQRARILGAFFLTYALFQIPMGALADRFGTRLVLTISIAAWSTVTAATGFIEGFAALVVVRLLLGITESGAYPAAAGLVKRWARPEERGRFSSIVAFGGRIGGAAAPALTAVLAAALAGVGIAEAIYTPSPAASHLAGASRVNWRGVFIVYGACGLAVAALFWLCVRDQPQATCDESTGKQPDASDWHMLPAEKRSAANFWETVWLLANSRNMWLSGGVQFGVNIGWAFLITLLPTYLNAVGIPLEQRGQMQSVALVAGCCGMLCGGFVTDWLSRQFGPRYGRSLPIGVAMSICSLVYFLSPAMSSAWAVVAALGVMAFFVDLSNPSIWSFAQDVGGKKVGAALGWGNMWGNLGASISPTLMTAIQHEGGWNMVFICSGISFAAAAACGFALNATVPVDPEDAG